jgi:hypothetical protein
MVAFVELWAIMKTRTILVLLSLSALVACGEAPKKQAATQEQQLRKPCTTPEQAGTRAAEITRKLVERRRADAITADQYAAYNNMMSAGFKSWAERQDLKAYCATLDRVSKEAALD